jgi:hypothetical protein
MRSITFFGEVSMPFQLKPNFFSAPFPGGKFKRVVWLWFAVGWAPCRLDEWHKLIKAGLLEWVERP